MHKKGTGVYIHVPFCIQKCNYCDFCSYTKKEQGYINDYVNELCRRINAFGEKTHNKIFVDTVYFGGGTPTLLSKENFEVIMLCLCENFDISKDAEITVECNPASIDKDGLHELRKIGINRLSIGLQSANENELRLLGRIHSFEVFLKTFDDARAVGFDNISVDLMYGIPEQTVESFCNTLKKVCEISPEHVSAYGLKIEEGTVFAKKRNELTLPNEDEEYEMYCTCEEILKNNGYERYEISNFAKSGYESKHNIHYWELDDYIGFGVAAYSLFDGERFGNSRDISAFLDGKDITCERSRISDNEFRNEYVMLGLRLQKGICMDEYRERFGRDFKTDFPQIDGYVSQGFLIEDNGCVFFSTKGFFVSNAILSQMLDFED